MILRLIQFFRQYASYVVENLTKLIFKVSHNQFQALKLLLQNWVNQDILHKSCFQLMWERFTLSLPNVTEEESRASLVLLGMVARLVYINFTINYHL